MNIRLKSPQAKCVESYHDDSPPLGWPDDDGQKGRSAEDVFWWVWLRSCLNIVATSPPRFARVVPRAWIVILQGCRNISPAAQNSAMRKVLASNDQGHGATVCILDQRVVADHLSLQVSELRSKQL